MLLLQLLLQQSSHSGLPHPDTLQWLPDPSLSLLQPLSSGLLFSISSPPPWTYFGHLREAVQMPASSPLPGTDSRQTMLLSLTVPLLSVKVQREIYTHTHTGVSIGIQVWLGQVERAPSDGTTSHSAAPQAGHSSWHSSQGLWCGAGTVLLFLRFLLRLIFLKKTP